ncbi:hypothetical protein U9M48_021152 [Paspalum notatum var. saurae]|uniref:Uncharacterized protein n=1 Tax=Paspalum notatum var. saurae TaxID=547442 RepID=A0AAQ3TGN6_PASNO
MIPIFLRRILPKPRNPRSRGEPRTTAGHPIVPSLDVLDLRGRPNPHAARPGSSARASTPTRPTFRAPRPRRGARVRAPRPRLGRPSARLDPDAAPKSVRLDPDAAAAHDPAAATTSRSTTPDGPENKLLLGNAIIQYASWGSAVLPARHRSSFGRR